MLLSVSPAIARIKRYSVPEDNDESVIDPASALSFARVSDAAMAIVVVAPLLKVIACTALQVRLPE